MIDIIGKIRTLITSITYPVYLKKQPVIKPCGEKLDLSKFKLVLEDNFDGEEIDKSIWGRHSRHGKSVNIRKGGYWAPSQAFILDNQLHIRTEYKKDGEFGEGYYSEALDTSGLFEQTYGYFECRCKLPRGEGLWSAFWLHSNNVKMGIPASRAMEIDVFESPYYCYSDKRNTVSSNLHCSGYGAGSKSECVGIFQVDNPYDSFNTYGVEWNEKEYIFYINGVESSRSSAIGVSHANEYMILSVEIDGAGAKPANGWSGNIKNNPEGTLPTDFIVDYVRVYQYKDKI